MDTGVLLFVKGRNDGVMRRVIHMPVHGGLHQTRIVNNEKQFFGFRMLLNGVEQIISENRLVRRKIRATGPLS